MAPLFRPLSGLPSGASYTLTVVNVRPLSVERARKTCRGVSLRARSRKSLATKATYSVPSSLNASVARGPYSA